MTQPQATELLSDAEIDGVLSNCYMALRQGGWNGSMGGLTWDRSAARAIAAHLSSKREGEVDTYLMVGRTDDNFKTLTPPGLKKGIPVYVKATFAPGVITQPSTKQDSQDHIRDATKMVAALDGELPELPNISKLWDLIGDYWDVAYDEGREGREHDTIDAKAGNLVSAMQAELHSLLRAYAQQAVAQKDAEIARLSALLKEKK